MGVADNIGHLWVKTLDKVRVMRGGARLVVLGGVEVKYGMGFNSSRPETRSPRAWALYYCLKKERSVRVGWQRLCSQMEQKADATLDATGHAPNVCACVFSVLFVLKKREAW